MAKSTIENRVYLFESLASSYVAAASDVLGSADVKVQERAMRALAQLAWVSCVVADSGEASADEVRERVLERTRVSAGAAAPRDAGVKGKRKRKSGRS